jgi:hypothetical protein
MNHKRKKPKYQRGHNGRCILCKPERLYAKTNKNYRNTHDYKLNYFAEIEIKNYLNSV